MWRWERLRKFRHICYKIDKVVYKFGKCGEKCVPPQSRKVGKATSIARKPGGSWPCTGDDARLPAGPVNAISTDLQRQSSVGCSDIKQEANDRR